MILVVVGVSQFPFDRLLRLVEDLNLPEKLVVQCGPSTVRPKGAVCEPFLPMQRLAELVREARVVVSHAGVGTILLALTNGVRPVVVPRLRTFGEAVDDHQLECARRFAKGGVVTLAEDSSSLQLALELGVRPDSAVNRPNEHVQLVEELRSSLDYIVGVRRQTAVGR